MIIQQDLLKMNVAPYQTIILGLQIFLDHRSLTSIDQKILMTPLRSILGLFSSFRVICRTDGMDRMGLVIIGHRSSKSTFGAIRAPSVLIKETLADGSACALQSLERCLHDSAFDWRFLFPFFNW